MRILTSPLGNDIPTAFQIRTPQGKLQLIGPYAQTIKHFARYNGYELHMVPMEHYRMSVAHRGIEEGLFNMSMHAGPNNKRFADISFSYPIEFSRLCIVVPAKEELPRFWYVLWPYDAYIWLLLLVAIVYTGVCMQWLRHPSTDLWQNMLKSFAVIWNSPNMGLKMVNAHLRLQIFYALLLLQGFILDSYYNSYLAAFNMRPIFQPHARTIDDILRDGLKVWVSEHLLEDLHDNPYADLSRLGTVLLEKPASAILKSLNRFSKAQGFVMSTTDWNMVVDLQKNLIQPIYKLSDVCFGEILMAYPIRLEQLVANKLQYFILRAHESGLWIHWQKLALLFARQAKYLIMPKDSYPVDPLNMAYYRIAWIVLFCGLLVSSLCLAVEIMVQRQQLRMKGARPSTSVMYVGDW